MSLLRGSADFLDIPNPNNHQFSVLREYLIQQGDRTVHFSGFCNELASTPIVDATQRKFLSWSPLQRTLIVTSKAIMYVPRTTEQSGIFFDCRLLLDDVAQIIVLDSDEYGKVIQLFVKTKDAKAAVSIASPFPNLVFPGQQIAVTLMFQDASVRKSMLMAVCSVRPQLSILQKKPVATSVPPPNSSAAGIQDIVKSPSTSARLLLNNSASFHSPCPQTPKHSRQGNSASPNTERRPTRFPQAKSFGTLAAYAAAATRHEYDALIRANTSSILTDDDFRAAQRELKEELLSALTVYDDEYDYAKAASRPPEEDSSRADEREEIRALLETRERKMCQHIEFKMKYPTKVATRVQPGVEYDKAHEERRVLPDDHCDDELLGPSLAPLWWRWKKTGGLDGLAKRSSADSSSLSDSSALNDEWNIFDSAELIDSLKAREEIVYGQVGPKSQARLQRMRELVQRELHMHKNRSTPPKNSSRGGGGGQITVPSPFSLSQSPVALRRMKMIDADKLISELRQSYDKHQQAVHQIRKAQLQREVHRAQGE